MVYPRDDGVLWYVSIDTSLYLTYVLLYYVRKRDSGKDKDVIKNIWANKKNLISFGVLIGMIALVVFGILTMLGGRVSQVFSNIDRGLSTGYDPNYDYSASSAPQAMKDMAQSGGSGDMQESPGRNAQVARNAEAIRRMIIKNANIALVVDDVHAIETEINNLAEKLDGYVIQTSTYGTGDNVHTDMTIRVPADSFESVLTSLQELAIEVTSQSVSGEDVTAEFVDLESRKRNLDVARDRLLALMEEATEVQDALEVSNALTGIQGEIEVIQGRMKYLEQSAAMSTIVIGLSMPNIEPIIEEDGWKPATIARSALRTLVQFGQLLASIAIFVGVWVPVWAPIVLLAWWLRRRYVARQKTP